MQLDQIQNENNQFEFDQQNMFDQQNNYDDSEEEKEEQEEHQEYQDYQEIQVISLFHSIPKLCLLDFIIIIESSKN